MVIPILRYFLFAGIISTFSVGALGQTSADVDETSQNNSQNVAVQTSDISRGTFYTPGKKRARRHRGCDRSAPVQYKKMRRNWQVVPKIKKPQWRNGYRDLTIYSVNLGTRVRVFPFLPDGTFDPEAVSEIEKAFADKHTGKIRSIHPRLIRLLYKLAVRFEATQINLISGFRIEAEGTESHHGNGSASDIVIPGVPLPALAKMARRLGHVGVGYYPVSGFVHLDVREGVSYFWTDPSGPGKRSCIRQIMAGAGFKFDRNWKASEDGPVQQTDRKGVPLDSTPHNEDTVLAAQNVAVQKND